MERLVSVRGLRFRSSGVPRIVFTSISSAFCETPSRLSCGHLLLFCECLANALCGAWRDRWFEVVVCLLEFV